MKGRKSAATTPRQSYAPAETAGITFSDPLINSTIKSQVTDVELINQRRAQFVKTAITLFRAKGYHNTTIKEIAKAAGVSAGLIYQYVVDKEDVLFLALQHIVQAYKRALPAATENISHPLQKFIAAFEAYFRVIDINRDASMLTYVETKTLSVQRRGALKQMEREVNELLAQPLRQAIREGYVRDIDVDMFATVAAVGVHAWALKHWRLKELTDIDAYIRFMMDVHLRSIVTEKGRKALDEYLAGR